LLSDGSPVELCQGGKFKQVTQENLEEYRQLVINTRLNEAKLQMQSILEGVELVIPIEILKLLSWS